MKKKFFKKFWLRLFAMGTCFLLASCHKGNNPSPVTPPKLGSTDWTRISIIPNEKIAALEVANNIVYAASASGIVYQSVDNETIWSASSVVGPRVEITSLAIFNNEIFVGTYNNGIYASTDNGKTWANSGTEISPVSSFAVWNNNLYSSSLYYAGIFILNQNDNSWASFTKTGLPTNYSLDVEKLIAVNQTLLSIQGENGTFYTFNPTANQWKENYYLGSSFTPGISVEDMIYDQQKFLASFGRQLIYSNNGGSNWSYDTVGLKTEIATGFVQKTRVLYAGTNNDYILSNMPKGGTWVQQRDKSAAAGTTWVTNDTFLQLPANFYSYSIVELNSTLFLATDNGVYFRKSG